MLKYMYLNKCPSYIEVNGQHKSTQNTRHSYFLLLLLHSVFYLSLLMKSNW